MKKLMTMLAAILILSACSSQTASNKMNEEKENVETEENKAIEENTTKDKEKEALEQDTADVEEEQVTTAPEYKMNENNYALEPIGKTNPKVVLLTIDDAPDKYALEMAQTLKKLDAPAIFFVNGHFINTPEKEQVLKDIYELGFEIGNHTYSHSDLTTLTPEKQREEILSVSNKIEEITGVKPKFFRAPFGANTDISRQIASEENMLVMNWTYGYDWEKQYMTKDAIADIMINTEFLRDGANLLMHDREWTNAGLEEIVTGLRDKGYETLDPSLIEAPKND
ncbi:polysaccharide deacetylase family protein [Lederbergia citrea]|uniref:polysaccharide deacetylase family protein n=1 Tax=Lederbergia citrea TaxID=2833581 RepID=UPI001BCA6021|nr:polysaccharide deacetylase family protein [Lederbergia citrea]MBS4177270.1 polysaccharide deacetylase family protein [Lederbergia citrea]